MLIGKQSAAQLRPQAPIEWIALIAIAIGVFLRCFDLNNTPRSVDIDEASILYWAKETLKWGKFYVYAPEGNAWEMLPGYLYHFASNFFWSPRVLPNLWGLLDLWLVYLLAKRQFSHQAGLMAAALLALSPWHIFFSRVVGTCMGLTTLVLWGFYLLPKKQSFWHMFRHCFGLLYYTIYRVFFIFEFLYYLKKKNYKQALWSICGALLFGLVVAISESPLTEIFTRGTYNFMDVKLNYAENIIWSFLVPFFPLAEQFRAITDHFMSDYVHTGFNLALGFSPAPGWGASLLFLGSLAILLRKPKQITNLPLFVFIALMYVALAFMGPSHSRFQFLAPLIALITVQGFEKLNTTNSYKALSLGLALLLMQSTYFISNLSNENKMQAVFHSRYQRLSSTLQKELGIRANKTEVYVASFYGFRTARYYSDLSQKFYALVLFPPYEVENLMKTFAQSSSQFIVIDTLPDNAEDYSGYPYSAKLFELEAYIRSRAMVLSEKELVDSGIKLGKLLEIQWH